MLVILAKPWLVLQMEIVTSSSQQAGTHNAEPIFSTCVQTWAPFTELNPKINIFKWIQLECNIRSDIFNPQKVKPIYSEPYVPQQIE